ncbi:RING-type E3 ubiquitin-protein ligase PPIL2 [Skeletonema marinoi]|uniref:RING-type E3 ubiquitin-protein ligase PPIL2 n=1 Tax=Skeletonema marinoi TaxID=267567 RepID=A0AAD9DDK3_9STRA|nr:RING-type E3 ubiquitin-protein ligase PPIL2 [Skeletonema marinoi]
MPKRQKEKQYQSAREHRANQSIRSGTSASSAGARPLPFDCCALTLTPFTTPVCSSDGIIFDNAAITPYLMKHKVDPVTGRPMTSRDLLILNMDKDESTGKWQCPVLNKPFTDRTKIVAIRQRPPGNEANVFCYEAYHELNVKAKNYLDLVSGLKFTKDDVIVLQDPNDERHCKLRDIQNFSHIHTQRDAAAAAAVINNNNNTTGDSGNVRHSVTASRIMDKLSREKRKREKAAEEASKKLLKTNDTDTAATSSSKKQQFIYTDELSTSINLTSGKASGSFTSTSMDVASENSSRLATEDEIITSQCEQMKRLKKKGTIRMFTNFGAMDIEIHCDIVPRTAMNFMLLAEKGEYIGSKFHRSIPNFMIQGGKKAGSKGKDDQGSSYWDKPFKDEFDDRLTHSGQGVLSMANSGPGTNGRQFFITYKSCSHLDRKHSVFGKVIRGLDILRRMEQIPTNKESDKPLETVKIESIEILDNPVSEALDLERRRIEKRKKEKQQLLDSRKSSPAVGLSFTVAPTVDATPQRGNDLSKNSNDDVASESFTIGKYLKVAKKDSSKATKQKQSEKSTDVDIGVSRLPPPPKKTSFGDFSGW